MNVTFGLLGPGGSCRDVLTLTRGPPEPEALRPPHPSLGGPNWNPVREPSGGRAALLAPPPPSLVEVRVLIQTKAACPVPTA